MIKYKGYSASVTFDDDAGILFGRVSDIDDVITFHGTSVEEIRRAFHESVDFYLAFCAEHGDTPEVPGSRQAAS